MDFTKLLENAWFVGIVGGIISGLIVFIITGKVFSSRKEKDIISANQEIIQAVKGFFIQSQPIDNDIVLAMIEATALKYRLKADDLYSFGDIADYLIKDIMETGFLAVENKKVLCELIYNSLKKTGPENEVVETKKQNISDITVNFQALSLPVAVLTASFTFVFIFKQISFFDSTDSVIASVGKPMVIVLTVFMVVLKITESYINKRKEILREETNKKIREIRNQTISRMQKRLTDDTHNEKL